MGCSLPEPSLFGGGLVVIEASSGVDGPLREYPLGAAGHGGWGAGSFAGHSGEGLAASAIRENRPHRCSLTTRYVRPTVLGVEAARALLTEREIP